MHEFEQFVDDRLQEFPMGFQETRILANNIHDIGGDNSLVVLSALNLAKSQKVANDCDEESLLGLLVYARG